MGTDCSALKHYTPEHATWRLLKDLYDKTVPDSQTVSTMGRTCAFCDAACGKTIRQCATDVMGSEFAGRRALKAKIRHVEALNGQGVDMQRKTDELFDVYLKVRDDWGLERRYAQGANEQWQK